MRYVGGGTGRRGMASVDHGQLTHNNPAVPSRLPSEALNEKSS
jgi:hypothetical protein